MSTSYIRIATMAFIFASAWPSIAQQPAASEAAANAVAVPLTLESLGWLEGCWRGAVNQREFREHWLPQRGGMMIGAGHTVMQDKTQDFDYMRIEARPDGVYY